MYIGVIKSDRSNIYYFDKNVNTFYRKKTKKRRCAITPPMQKKCKELQSLYRAAFDVQRYFDRACGRHRDLAHHRVCSEKPIEIGSYAADGACLRP